MREMGEKLVKSKVTASRDRTDEENGREVWHLRGLDGSALDHSLPTTTRVRISGWAYLKGVLSLTLLHYL